MKVSIINAAIEAAQEATATAVTILPSEVAKGAFTDKDWKDIDRSVNTYQRIMNSYNKLAYPNI